MDFGEKYDATPFDAGDPLNVIAENARKALTRSVLEVLNNVNPTSGEELQMVAAGLLVGIVGVVRSMGEKTDANDASIRAGLIEMVPWAVDMVRSIDHLQPLSDAN